MKNKIGGLLILLIGLISCRPNNSDPIGEYSTTCPTSGRFVPNGYQKVELRSDGTCMVSQEGDLYTNYGNWDKIEDGIRLYNISGDFNNYNGVYKWVKHNNGKGVGEEGDVLDHIDSGYEGDYLYPLPEL